MLRVATLNCWRIPYRTEHLVPVSPMSHFEYTVHWKGENMVATWWSRAQIQALEKSLGASRDVGEELHGVWEVAGMAT